MVKFLINRPIALIMSFMALIFLGMITLFQIPVSLMPGIDIPEITVQINHLNSPARELENTVVKPIRQRLLQVGHLRDIESETRDGYALIRMKFTHGTDVDYAYIETNEKIDQALNEGNIPKEMSRPRVIKASAADIPVFNILVNRKADWTDENRFMELSEFVRSVIIKRIEQLPEVAMVDISGYTSPKLEIVPDYEKMEGLGIEDDEILNAIERNNRSVGSLMVREGYYQYHINFANYLKDVQDIGDIFIGKGDRLMQLKDLARLKIIPQERSGLFVNRHKNAICLAIIKQSDSRMEDLKQELTSLLEFYETTYTDLDFEIEKDQTKLLEISIDNLKQSLMFGALLAILIMFLFLKDFRSPILIAFSIPVSLMICFLLFYLLNISINIISLSGLILAVGMMIDNSIIVIDNINQYRDRGESLDMACIKGTNEVIRPLISSVLTTCAVFIPLIFLSGIAGALFFDQAVAIAVGLVVSFMVSITLLPMLFRLFYLRKPEVRTNRILARINRADYEKMYDRSFNHVFKYKWIYGPGFLALLAVAAFLFTKVPVKSFPDLEQTETIVNVDWNEPIHVDENIRRVQFLLDKMPDSLAQYSTKVGEQQFFLTRGTEQTVSESEIYWRCASSQANENLVDYVKQFLAREYPMSSVSFSPPDNIFEALFSDDIPELMTMLSSNSETGLPEISQVQMVMDSMVKEHDLDFVPVPVSDQIVIEVNPERLLLYKVEYRMLENVLRRAFNQRSMGTLKSYQQYIPITLGDEKRSVIELVNELFVTSREGIEIPLSSLIELKSQLQYKTIRANRHGEYVPLEPRILKDDVLETRDEIQSGMKSFPHFNVDFDGSFFRQKDLIRELAFVLGIALLLLYFILSAQFESFVQPLIVLIELPIDIAGALFMLYIFGGSLNVMSAIGIIVMSGIIINDSILKIDTINRTRRSGKELIEAIHIGGRRRLKPIIMTSLTTILALTPFLFFEGLGAELQRPLALAVIGGMTLGTFVSLYFIPLAYWAIYNRRQKVEGTRQK